jgi:YggT family protein
VGFASISPAVNIVDAIAWILTILIIARIIISWIGVYQGNPIVQVVTGIVDPILRPFRRILPAFGGIDFSPLLALIVIQVIQSVVDNVVVSGTQQSLPELLFVIVAQLLSQIDLFICVVVGLRLLLQVLQSSPFHPANSFMRSMTDPFVRPFRGVGRGTSGVVVAFVFYVVLYVVIRNLAVDIHF